VSKERCDLANLLLHPLLENSLALLFEPLEGNLHLVLGVPVTEHIVILLKDVFENLMGLFPSFLELLFLRLQSA
jgi:hypothetical protein